MMRTWSSLRSDSKALAHARHSVQSQRVRRILHRHERLRSLTSDGIRNTELSSHIAPDSNGSVSNSPRDEDQYAASLAIQEQLSDIAMLEGDTVMAKELKENGFRSTRRTKLICTIGPSSCSFEVLEALARGGMNVARLNMCHGNHEWHRGVIERIKRLNHDKGYSVAIMVDTEGSEIHSKELPGEASIKAEEGDNVVFTIRNPPPPEIRCTPCIGVSYENFVEDVEVGDSIIVDGGMVTFSIVAKAGPDVVACCRDPGLLLSRANLTFRRGGELIRGKNTMLPVVSSKDWMDIDFAISMGADFLAVSFVKSADVLHNLRDYLRTRCPDRTIELIAKIESYDAMAHLEDIIAASDGVMVARADLGAQIPVEDVPSVQKYVVVTARQMGKPSIVASQLLQSMIEYPIPTRAEVSDVADVVRQRADALMLSGESAMGRYPQKALGVLRSVSASVEEWVRQEKYGVVALPSISKDSGDGRVSEEVCAAAVMMANSLGASAIFVYTRRGYMANFLSRHRPDCPIFSFTDQQEVRQRLNLRWGVVPFRQEFAQDPEDNIQRTFKLLKARGYLAPGDLVVVVSDMRPREQDTHRSVQVRKVQ